MKRILLTFLAVTLCTGAFSQVRYGLTAGYLRSASQSSSSLAGQQLFTNSGNDNGFFAGFLIDYETYVDNLIFETGFLFNYLTDKEDGVRETITIGSVPLHARYGFDLTEGLQLFAFGGPTASLNIAAESKGDKITVNYLAENGFLKRFDLKMGVGVGVEIGEKLSVRVGYDWGLLNQSKNKSATDASIRLNLFHAGVAVMF